MIRAATVAILSMLLVIFIVSGFAMFFENGVVRRHFVYAGLLSGAVFAGILSFRAWALHR